MKLEYMAILYPAGTNCSIRSSPEPGLPNVTREEAVQMVSSWGSEECVGHNFFPSAPTIVSAYKTTCINIHPSSDTACGL